jgi:hypothetical protein
MFRASMIFALAMAAHGFGDSQGAPPRDAPPVFATAYVTRDFDLTADPRSPEWVQAPWVEISRDYFGAPLAGRPTVVRSRWSDRYLYLLFTCPYDTLNLKPDPTSSAETPQLWNWDVAEVFIGWDFDHIGRYKELQVSPQGEWVDLDINRDDSKAAEGMRWNSAYLVKARIDEGATTWYGEMRIPFGAIDARPPQPGRELRIGLYRIAGIGQKQHYAWSPTGQANFHVPAAFGTLRLQ